MPNQYFRLDNTTSQDAFAVQYLSSVTKLSHEELMLKHKDLIEKTRVNIYNNNKEAIDYKNNSFRNDSLIEVDLDKVCNILRGSVLERKETVVQELPAKQIGYISSNSVRFLNNNLTDHIEINVKPSIKHSKTDFENSKIKTGLQINDDAKNQNEITKTVTCASAKFKYIHKNDRKFDFTIGSDFSNVLKPSPDRILNTIPGSISFETGVLNTNARLNTKLANNVSFSMDTNLRIKKFDPLDKDFLKIKPSQIIENSDLKITSGIKYEANGFHANGDIRYCIKKYDIKKNELTDGYEARVGVGYKYSLYENKNTKQSWQIFASASSTFENFEKHKKSLACLGILFKYKNLETKISLDGLYSNMIFMSGLNVAAEYTFEGKNAK